MNKSKDARIRELEKRNAALEARVADLEKLLTQALTENTRLKKSSRTSSKPPSSDITKPPSSTPGSDGSGSGGGDSGGTSGGGRKKKRSIGGQKGHPRNQRQAFPSERVDEAFEYDFAPSDAPGDDWELLDSFHIHQQVELRDDPLRVTEHRFAQYRHKQTGRIINAPVPEALRRQGLFGPRLRALTATLKGDLHASYRGIARLYNEALDIDISTGYLVKIIKQTSNALADPYDTLCAALPDEPVLNLDETSHRDRGERPWLWGAVAQRLTVFKIAARRNAAVIESLLGLTYQGIIGCDFHSAYRKLFRESGGCSGAFCWAHLIREVRYLTTLSDKVTANWANKLLDMIRRLFKAYHTQGKRAQQNAKQAILECVRRPPERGEAQTLAKRIQKQKAGYFLFLEHPDVEPTNNVAERALRHGVIQRKMTQGTRGDTGQRWVERMLSVRATCQQQGRSFHAYLVDAITAHTNGRESPAILA